MQDQTTQHDAQFELEKMAQSIGITRYQEALAKRGNSAVPAGQQLIKAAMEPMIEALKEWLGECSKGVPSRSASLYHFLNQLEPTGIAWLTAHAAISMLHEQPRMTKVASSLALSLESAVTLEAVCKENPALGAKIAKKVERINVARQKALFVRRGAGMVDVLAVAWDDSVRVRVGAHLLQMFAASTGLITLDTVPLRHGKTQTVLRATESCRKWLEVSHARCELLSPLRMPMVCPPRAWTSPFNGGYLTPALRQPLVKTRNRAYLSELKEWDMPLVYASINALQDTAWAVNMPVLEAIRAVWESSGTTGGIPSRENVPLPARTWVEGQEPDPQALHLWKVAAAKTHETNKRSESHRQQLVSKLWIAEQMVERGNRFHFVYNMDWRGRLYPIAAGLNPQGDDTAKAMLQFAEGVPLGSEGAFWLAVHGAGTYGVDKVSFDDRIAWVEEYTEQILASANDPLGGNGFWTEADAPYQFLAFCLEWARLQAWVDAGKAQEEFVSALPVAFDGACNGLQNFSAMLRDEVGGAATGLIPGQKPADIYSEVARATQALIDRDAADADCEHTEVAQRWVGKMTRSLAKRNTMTVPYGVTRRGMRDQLFGELRSMASAGSDVSAMPEDASYLAACNYEAIGTVVVAARRAMDWLRDVAKVAASNQLPVRWTTPVGFLAVQDYRVEVGQDLDFSVLGRRFRLMLNRTGDKLNTRKQALGISPNFVHSLDAAHLMRTVLHCKMDGMESFAMIHDSYGCPAGQAATLRDNLRGAFVEQYSEPVLQRFLDELKEQLPADLVEQLPPLPPMGSLDLEQVKQSDYFFA